MNDPLLAIVSVVVTWWLSTGVVLRVVWLPPATHRASVAVVSALALVAGYGVWWASTVETVGAAYLGFGCALTVWAWHEVTFLLGVITGPRKLACAPEAAGWSRFRDATAAIIHHELALALTAVVLVALTWGAPNQVATWTFLVLWAMRLSAKLNVFVGVRNLAEDFVPPHLRYLTSYFRRSRFSVLVAVSVVAASAALVPLARVASSMDANEFTSIGHTLVATILALGIVEHVFLAFPLPDAVLWRWIVRNDRSIGGTARSERCPSTG
jgi:putative photosynthetic complex assembly protein 2